MLIRLWQFLRANSETLGFLLAALTAICGAAWAVYVRRRSKTEPVATTTIVNQGITLEDYERAIKRKESEIRAELGRTALSDPVRRELLEGQLERAQEKAKNLESEFESYKTRMLTVAREYEELKREVIPSEITPDVLPAGLKVKGFVPDDHLTLAITGLRTGARIFRAAFGVCWAGGFSFFIFVATRHLTVALLFFVVVFSVCFTQYRITFDFKKKKVRIFLPGSYARLEPIPVLVRTRHEKMGWAAVLSIGSLEFASLPPLGTEKEARLSVLPFVRAVNWKMGIPLLISEDVESPAPQIRL